MRKRAHKPIRFFCHSQDLCCAFVRTETLWCDLCNASIQIQIQICFPRGELRSEKACFFCVYNASMSNDTLTNYRLLYADILCSAWERATLQSLGYTDTHNRTIAVFSEKWGLFGKRATPLLFIKHATRVWSRVSRDGKTHCQTQRRLESGSKSALPSMLGTSPLLCAKLRLALAEQHETSFPVHMLYALSLLKLYQNEHVHRVICYGVDETTFRKYVWKYLSLNAEELVDELVDSWCNRLDDVTKTWKRSTLFALQIDFENRIFCAPINARAYVSIDATQSKNLQLPTQRFFRDMFLTTIRNRFTIRTGDLVWVVGGYPCGSLNDLKRRETVNILVKRWAVLRVPFRHDLSKHRLCFYAIAHIIQVMQSPGERLYDVQIDENNFWSSFMFLILCIAVLGSTLSANSCFSVFRFSSWTISISSSKVWRIWCITHPYTLLVYCMCMSAGYGQTRVRESPSISCRNRGTNSSMWCKVQYVNVSVYIDVNARY